MDWTKYREIAVKTAKTVAAVVGQTVLMSYVARKMKLYYDRVDGTDKKDVAQTEVTTTTKKEGE